MERNSERADGRRPILQVTGLKHYYKGKHAVIPAVDGVDAVLYPGEIVGIVGESGCGKSTVAKSLMGLVPARLATRVAGEAWFEGVDLFRLPRRLHRQKLGRSIAMIFQSPRAALDPVYTIGDQLCEAIQAHESLSRAEARTRAVELLKQVQLPAPEIRLDQYPHEMSGGMLQRVMIAIALSCRPAVLLADEPTTALDVTIQAQILTLLKSLRDSLGLAILLITHNIGVVASICDRVLVMYGGVVVEEAACRDLFASPQHPYTRGLLAAIPSISNDASELFTIPGQVPSFHYPVTRCRFAGRCACETPRCLTAEPELRPTSTGKSRCHYSLAEQRQAEVSDVG